MLITNVNGVPDIIVSAVKNFHASHKKTGDFSVTGIIKPVQMILLEEKHKGELQSDVVDNLWSLMGSAMHNILEVAENVEGVHKEYHGRREISGVTISGTSDVVDTRGDGCITDYKLTSAWTHIGGVKPEWALQLSIYRWLFAEKHAIKSARICCLFRDWSRNNMLRSYNYPRIPFMVYDVPLMDLSEVESFLTTKIHAIKSARESGIMPPCTPEETWSRGGSFAVMKRGRKSAVKLHDTLQSAIAHKNKLDAKHYIEERKPECTRCDRYCSVSKWCEQFQNN